MKTASYIIVFGCLLLSSCIVEEYPKPPKTSMAKNVVDKASYSIVQGIRYSDIAIKTNAWLSASTTAEKVKTEDLYFPNFKLRMSGDTIIVLNLCKINSFGKKLQEPGSKWTFIDWSDQDTAFISKPAEDEYSISLSHRLYSSDLTITSRKNSYLVAGSGKQSLEGWEMATYQISDGIVVDDITPTIYADPDGISRHFIGGANNFKWYRDSDTAPENIKVQYAPFLKSTITAFGFTDTYYGRLE